MLKRAIFLTTIIVPLVFYAVSSFSGQSISSIDDIKELEVYNKKGEPIGVVKRIKDKLIIFDNDSVTIKKHKKDEWRIYNMSNKYVGKLVRNNNHLRLYDKNGNFTHFSLYIKERGPKAAGGTRKLKETKLNDEFEYLSTLTNALRITSESAKLYSYVMKAFK